MSSCINCDYVFTAENHCKCGKDMTIEDVARLTEASWKYMAYVSAREKIEAAPDIVWDGDSEAMLKEAEDALASMLLRLRKGCRS